MANDGYPLAQGEPVGDLVTHETRTTTRFMRHIDWKVLPWK